MVEMDIVISVHKGVVPIFIRANKPATGRYSASPETMCDVVKEIDVANDSVRGVGRRSLERVNAYAPSVGTCINPYHLIINRIHVFIAVCLNVIVIKLNSFGANARRI